MRPVHFVCICLTLASTLMLAQSNPVPFVDQPLVPMSAPPGGAGFTLTVNGGNFISGSVVKWNGNALPTTFVSRAQLTATVTASDIATAQTAWVTVTNPAPGGGTSGLSFFPIAEPESGVVLSATPYPAYAAAIAADFNGDGKLDLAVETSAQTNSVSILLGNGDGTFKKPTATYPISGTPFVVGDFNGDGKLDLIAGETVLFGNGDGTFTAGPSLTQNLPYMVAGDFNGDGKLDLAGIDNAVFDAPTLVVMLGNGDGTFQALTPVALDSYCLIGAPREPPCAGNALLAADFNNNGVLDLALLVSSNDSNGNVVVFLGNGDGTFQVIPPPGCNTNGMSFAAADFNGDGKQDLAFIGQITGIDAYTLFGNGDGTCGGRGNFVHVYYSGPIFPGDFNTDGKLDLATSASVAVGDGKGGFSTISSYGPVYTLQAVGDFNNDGRLDLVGASSDATGTASTFSVLLQVITPVVTRSTGLLNFSNPQFPGTTSSPQMATLTNTGNATLTITSIKLAGTDPGDFAQTNTCGSSLVAGASCTISVTFTPLGGGRRIASVQIADNAPGSPQVVALSGTAQDFSVSATPTSTTVTPGQAANYTLSISPLNAFSGKVALTCSGQPPQSTCTVSPSSATLNGSSNATADVAVVTAGASASLVHPYGFLSTGGRLALWLTLPGLSGLALMVGSGGRSRRRQGRRLYGLAFLCLFSVAITWSACGGGSGGSGGGGTPAGTYTVTVTGTFTSGPATVTHSAPLTLIVQ